MTYQPVPQDTADGFRAPRLVGLALAELIERFEEIIVKAGDDLLALAGGRSPP